MKLKTLISEWLEENGEPETKRRRAYVLAVSGLREMAYDVTAIVKSEEIEINQQDSVSFPVGFVNLTRLGIVNSAGIIQAFASNPNISLVPNYNNCGQPVPYNINLQQGINQGTLTENAFLGFSYIGNSTYIASHYRNGENTGAFFGRGGGQEGIYRIDWDKRQIQFGSLPLGSTKILLEYLADVESIDGDFEIHPFMVLALKEWVSWRWLIPTKREGEIAGAKQRYNQAFGTMRRRFNSETPFDWLNAMRRNNSATTKW